mmetsp:Transcript_4510/g.10354  ORF Transcript_4510/g.10354 Transcript_4510/m.10354 type:complete len:133 (-) Transcript_4510:63-461(-)
MAVRTSSLPLRAWPSGRWSTGPAGEGEQDRGGDGAKAGVTTEAERGVRRRRKGRSWLAGCGMALRSLLLRGKGRGKGGEEGQVVGLHDALRTGVVDKLRELLARRLRVDPRLSQHGDAGSAQGSALPCRKSA